MSTWELLEQEWEALDRRRFATTEAAVFRNATIILMTAVGRAKASIAQDLGCSPTTVDNVRQRYRQQGLAGLRRSTPPGRRARAPAAYRTALGQARQTPPGQLGYGLSVWSVARVGQPLKKTTSVACSEDHLRRWVHAEGFSFPRPKHPLKGKRDEAAYEPARPERQDWKTKPSPRKRTSG